MLKTKTWIVIIAILLLLSLGLALFLSHGKPSAHTAKILINGQCVDTIDLSLVKDPYSRELTFEDGESNLLQIEPGRIRISEATCPDKVCVNTGWISSEGLPIVCLPHKLVIQLE